MVDESFMAAKQSHIRDDSPSKRELVSIKSTCIDLNCAIEEIQSPKHEHFSIRGYVSETRKTDKKTCLPFAGDDMNLPPMNVPKFRWWQCSDCVPGDSDQTSAATAVGEKSLKNIAENEPEKVSSDIDAFSSLPPKWKRKQPRVYVKKVNKNASPPQLIEGDELSDLNAARTRCLRKRNLDEEMAPVDKKLKGPVIEISDSDSEKENRMPTSIYISENPRRSYTKKRTVRTKMNPPVAVAGGVGSSNQESSGKNTGIPDLNEPFVESYDDDNTSDDIPMDIVELLANIRHERAHVSSGPSMPTPTRKKVTFDIGPPSTSKLDAKHKGKSSKRTFPQGRMPPLMGSSRAPINLAGPSNLTAQPSRSNYLNLEVCTVNRNPADFSVPDDERNEYMLSGYDFEPKKRIVAPSKDVKGRTGGKQRARKDSSRK